MKIYIAQVLVEDIDLNSCHCEAFTDHEQARAYARKEIEYYAKQYNGQFEEYINYFSMQAGDEYVTIEIVEKELDINIKTTVPEMVDLGLPSGLKWAKWNVGANNETDYGLYFKYGEAEGQASNNPLHFDSHCPAKFTDAATVAYGNNYRMPTKKELQELLDNTDTEVTTVNKVKGMKYMRKSDHGVYIFIPFAGFCCNGSFRNAGYNNYLWSSTPYSDFAYCLYLGQEGDTRWGYNNRNDGFSVRAVSAQQ